MKEHEKKNEQDWKPKYGAYSENYWYLDSHLVMYEVIWNDSYKGEERVEKYYLGMEDWQ